MTMRAIAEQLGVSIPTLYRKLKAEGVALSDLRDEKTGKVTPAGAAVIADVFRGSTDDETIQDVLNGDFQSVSVETSRRDDADTVNAVLRVKLEAAEDKLMMVTAERDRLREQVDKLTAMLQAEQAQRVRLLESGHQRRGLFAWFKSRGNGGD